MRRALNRLGLAIVGHFIKPAKANGPTPGDNLDALRASLQPGDVLLVEGNSRASGVIKYLTRSIWSHVALYVGPVRGTASDDGEPRVLFEVEMVEGAILSPLSKYAGFNTRICRPVGLGAADRETVCAYALERVGLQYDVKNITDFIRYLTPMPVPRRWRRRMTALGSADPTRSICSALIAQAFQSVRYPVLPMVVRSESEAGPCETLTTRPTSFYTPGDFDISPYFAVIKPALEAGFDYRQIRWADALPLAPMGEAVTPVPARVPVPVPRALARSVALPNRDTSVVVLFDRSGQRANARRPQARPAMREQA